MAPIFQQAAKATNHSTELARAMVTMSPSVTPPAAMSRARRLADDSSSDRDRLTPPHVMAGRSGSCSASSVRRRP